MSASASVIFTLFLFILFLISLIFIVLMRHVQSSESKYAFLGK